VDANFYNGNLDQYAIVRVVFEFLASTGTYVNYFEIEVFSEPHYQTNQSRTILAFQIIVYIYLFVAFFLRELFEVTFSF
jgi:hypothetical protein